MTCSRLDKAVSLLTSGVVLDPGARLEARDIDYQRELLKRDALPALLGLAQSPDTETSLAALGAVSALSRSQVKCFPSRCRLHSISVLDVAEHPLTPLYLRLIPFNCRIHIRRLGASASP
jgi:hypothetical protein